MVAGFLAVLLVLAACGGADGGAGDARLGAVSECSGPLEEDPKSGFFSGVLDSGIQDNPLYRDRIKEYRSDYFISTEWAVQLLEREVEFEGILFSIRSLERSRVAGWGVEIINRVDKPAGRELKQTGWVWLVGDEPPCEDSARIAAGHPDVEIRTGAAHTHEELLEIAGWLSDRTGITREWEIYCMIQSVGVNMPANGIYIVKRDLHRHRSQI